MLLINIRGGLTAVILVDFVLARFFVGCVSVHLLHADWLNFSPLLLLFDCTWIYAVLRIIRSEFGDLLDFKEYRGLVGIGFFS